MDSKKISKEKEKRSNKILKKLEEVFDSHVKSRYSDFKIELGKVENFIKSDDDFDEFAKLVIENISRVVRETYVVEIEHFKFFYNSLELHILEKRNIELFFNVLGFKVIKFSNKKYFMIPYQIGRAIEEIYQKKRKTNKDNFEVEKLLKEYSLELYKRFFSYVEECERFYECNKSYYTAEIYENISYRRGSNELYFKLRFGFDVITISYLDNLNEYFYFEILDLSLRKGNYFYMISIKNDDSQLAKIFSEIIQKRKLKQII